MNLLAIDLTNLFRCNWIQGCVMILIFFWAFLALLGIRNARFPWRILGGLSFVIGSTLWLGLHPAIELDTGDLGRIVQHSLAGRISSAFALSGLSALLLVCSLIGLLVAIDWLPLIPFAPMLARADERRDRRRLASVPTDFVSPKIERPDDDLALARTAAATMAPRVRAPAPSAAPVRSEPPAPTAAAPLPLPSIEPPAAVLPPPLPPPPMPLAFAAPSLEQDSGEDELDDPLADDLEGDDDEAPTNWARFRPRTRAEDETTLDEAREVQSPQPETAADESPEIAAEMPVDKGSATSHNSTSPEGESRAVEDDATEVADAPVGSSDTTHEDVIATEEKKEDAPVLDRDQDSEEALTGATAVADPLPEAPEAALAETLAPRRKKEEEEPAEEPEKEDDEEEGEEGEEEEGDEEDFDDEDSEEDDEEFEEEEDDKEEDKEEEEEEEEEDWDEDEEEEEEEEDEDDDEDFEEDDEEEDDEDDDEEEKEGDDDRSERSAPPASAEADAASVSSAAEAPEVVRDVVEEETAAPEAPDSDVEILTPEPAEPAASAPSPVRPEVAALLFPDLPEEDRTVMVRAIDLIAGTESVSLSRLQRELGITYYAAARVFERLEKEGFLAPYTGSLARTVRITREEWTSIQSDGGAS